MRVTLIALIATVSLLLLLSARGGAQSLPELPVAAGGANSPVVAELFTSQSCSSCPPAEKLFSGLTAREDLIVLEWHVDYWDRLVHGRAGAWKDPYSDPAHTKRQRAYNRKIRKTAGVYTPQAVINGTHEAVGHDSTDVERLLVPARHRTVDVSVAEMDQQIEVRVAEYGEVANLEADIYQLTLLPSQTTRIPRGENRGAVLSSKNIVLEADRVGTYSGEAATLILDHPKTDQTCAIIIQERRNGQLGPILGASYCS